MVEKTAVLIPSYNEARTIGSIIKELKARGLVVYVIDDGSTDGTANIAESNGAVVMKHKKNKGKGASLREGFRHILKKDFSQVLIMDGDDQHEVGDIDHFFKKADESGADMIIGNRMFDTSSMPYTRVLTNRFMSSVISKIAGCHIPDSQCGFRLIKKGVLQAVQLESSNYEIESEMILKAARKGFKIDAVPIRTVYQNERSRINPVIDTIRFIILLVKVAFKKV